MLPELNSYKLNSKNPKSLITRWTLYLALIGTIPLLIILLFGPKLFGLFFGTNWVEAGVYAQYISLFVFFNFINRPAVTAIPIYGLQKWQLKWEVFNTVSKSIALLACIIYFDDPLYGLLLMSIIGSIGYLYLIFKIIQKTDK